MWPLGQGGYAWVEVVRIFCGRGRGTASILAILCRSLLWTAPYDFWGTEGRINKQFYCFRIPAVCFVTWCKLYRLVVLMSSWFHDVSRCCSNWNVVSSCALRFTFPILGRWLDNAKLGVLQFEVQIRSHKMVIWQGPTKHVVFEVVYPVLRREFYPIFPGCCWTGWRFDVELDRELDRSYSFIPATSPNFQDVEVELTGCWTARIYKVKWWYMLLYLMGPLISFIGSMVNDDFLKNDFFIDGSSNAYGPKRDRTLTNNCFEAYICNGNLLYSFFSY